MGDFLDDLMATLKRSGDSGVVCCVQGYNFNIKLRQSMAVDCFRQTLALKQVLLLFGLCDKALGDKFGCVNNVNSF